MATTDPTTGSSVTEYLIQSGTLENIAAAIRAKNGSSDAYTPSAMVEAIKNIFSGPSIPTYTWDQQRDEVKNFLENVTYDPSDYTVSQIANYAPSTGDGTNYPIGKAVSASGEVHQLDVYSKIDYVHDETGTPTFYNNVPGKYHPVTVMNNNGVSAAFILNPTGSLRMCHVPGTFNVRDLGGWACDGGTIKYGLLFRGGKLYESCKDVCLNQLGIRCDLDLRGTSEAGNLTESPLGSTVDYVCPVNFNWYSISDKATWKENLECVIDHVVKNEPVYFHCTAGADRTGTLACILEALLGVSQSDIDKDYELTSFYSGVGTDNNARRRNESDWKTLINAINALSGSTFRDKAITFAKSCGISVTKLNAFRKAMSTGTPETLTGTTFTITVSGQNYTCSNSATSIEENGSYSTIITPAEGYALTTVTVIMGDTDITASTYNGQSHSITIANVTGNVAITISAESTASINIIDTIGIAADTRVKTSNGANADASGYAAIGSALLAENLVHLPAGKQLTIMGGSLPSTNDSNCAIVLYTKDGTFISSTYAYSGMSWNGVAISSTGSTITIKTTYEEYLRVSFVCSDATSVTATVSDILEDVQLYSTSNPTLNTKFSGTSMVTGNGSYLVYADVSGLDLSKYKYLKVSGAHMYGYSGVINASNPIFYKIGYMKGLSSNTVQYTNSQALATDAATKEFTIDMSANKNNAYSECDKLIFMIMVSTSAITSSDVLSTDTFKIMAVVA